MSFMPPEFWKCKNCDIKLSLEEQIKELEEKKNELSFLVMRLQNDIDKSGVIRCKDCNKWKTNDCMVLLLVGRAYFMDPTNQNHPPENFYCAHREPKIK